MEKKRKNQSNQKRRKNTSYNSEIRRRRSAKKRQARRATLLAMLLLLGAAIGIVVSILNPSASGLVQSGTRSLEKQEYEKATEAFQKAIRAEEKKPQKKKTKTVQGTDLTLEAYRGLGMIAFAQNEYEQAIEYLQKVVDQGGANTPVIYNMIGVASMQLEDYAGALATFEQGISLPEEGSYMDQKGKEQQVDYGAVIQEMKLNQIVCYEKQLDWGNAKVAMEAYTATYPEDTSVLKEAEFLSTR